MVARKQIRPLLAESLHIKNTIYQILRSGREQSPIYKEFLRCLDMAKRARTPVQEAVLPN
jgi:hypothetical protein